MFAVASTLLGYFSSLIRPRHQLALEVLALRHHRLRDIALERPQHGVLFRSQNAQAKRMWFFTSRPSPPGSPALSPRSYLVSTFMALTSNAVCPACQSRAVKLHMPRSMVQNPV